MLILVLAAVVLLFMFKRSQTANVGAYGMPVNSIPNIFGVGTKTMRRSESRLARNSR